MTSQEKADLMRSYMENYHRMTGEHIRITTCSRWEAMVSFIEKADFWKLVKVVFDLTGWDKKSTYCRSAAAEKIFRRSLIDFIAVNNGCSYSMCARLTGRDHTTVLNSVRKFENRLETDAQTRAFFKEVMDYVRENYYIYENQDTNISNLG